MQFQILDHFKEPFVLVNGGMRIVEVNTAFASLLKCSRDELIGSDCRSKVNLSELNLMVEQCIRNNIAKDSQASIDGKVFGVSINPIETVSPDVLVSVCLRDLTGFIDLEKTLIKKNRELAIINTLSSAFISSDDLDSVFEDLLEKVLVVSDFSIGWISLKETEDYVLTCSSGISDEFKKQLEKGALSGTYDKFLVKNGPVDVYESHEVTKQSIFSHEGLSFVSFIALRSGSENIGLIAIASRFPVEFDFELASLFSLIGNTASLVAEKARMFQEIRYLAITDCLTDLYNIRYFYDILEREISRSKRYDLSFSLILFDIDDFKLLNDTHGHQAGDEVLQDLSAILKGVSRETDITARYGGEEFILLLPNTGWREAMSLASRIKDAVENHKYLSSKEIMITLSGGIASFPDDAQDSRSLLYAADMAMYSAKAKGKRRICLYGGKDETGIQET